MRIIKKYNIVLKLLMVIVIVSLFLNVKVNVYGETTTKSDDGQFNYTTVTEEVTKLSESTKYIKNTGYTTRGKTNYNQVNHVMVCDYGKGEDIKVVSWAAKNADNTGFYYRTIKSIGEDYEKTHPGYIVLCGINSDQYYMKFGTNLLEDSTDYYRPQTVYPMVSDGDTLFALSPYGYQIPHIISYTVGFPNDGSKLVFGDRSVKGFYLHIYDDNNNEIGAYKIDDLNMMDDIAYNETTVISPYRISDTTYQTMSKTSENGFFVVEAADLCYVNNTVEYAWYKGDCAVNSFFGKGRISKVTNEINLTKAQFAIETSNPTLKKLLSVGTYVKAQYDLDDGFANIKESTGFHQIQRLNGKDYACEASYCLCPYPRSIVGCDEDGRVYMITCNGKNSSPTEGMWFGESNALMKQYGITDAFQMDGGGSVTCVIRNENGELEYAMPSVESDYRQDLCGIFVVMKVTNATIDVTKRTQTTATLSCDLSNAEEDYTEAYIKYGTDLESEDAKLVKIENGVANLTGLSQNMNYKYQLVLKLANGETKTTYVKGGFDTYPNYPEISNVSVKLVNDKYKITVNYTDEYKMLNKMTIDINGKVYNLKYADGVGTVEIDSDVSAILDLKVELRCKPLTGFIENVEITEYKLDASLNVYYDHVVSSVNQMIYNFYE